MASLRSKFYSRMLRRTFRGRGFGEGLEALKRVRSGEDRSFILSLLSQSAPPHATTEINGNYAEWLGNPEAEYTLLYLHGGGYIMGGPDTHRNMVRALARYANVRALLLDYRLAPENPFPAAIEDAEAAYDWLLEQGVAPEKMFVAGDSAGGAKPCADAAIESTWQNQPKAAALLSPWTDLTSSGESARTRAERDPMIDINRMPEAIAYYCNEHPADDPISPVFADLAGLAPLFVQVGTEEVLFDDATRLVERAEAAGTKAELQIWDDMPHVHQIAFRWFPKPARLSKTLRGFSRAQWPNPCDTASRISINHGKPPFSQNRQNIGQ